MPRALLRDQGDRDGGSAIAPELGGALPSDIGTSCPGVPTGTADDGEGVFGAVGQGGRARSDDGAVGQVEGVRLQARRPVHRGPPGSGEAEVRGVEVAYPLSFRTVDELAAQ